MSYPRDIDDISELDLATELEKRKHDRAEGRCDYCHRSPDTPPCKYPDRHRDHRIVRGG